MTEPDPNEKPVHRRRARYRGTHPRSFAEKYKELAPEQYPEHAAHVRDRGRTPAGQHVPILVAEVLAALDPKPGELGVDATLGWGGHAERFLERIAPGGKLVALDVDPLESARAAERLERLGHGEESLVVRRTNFAALPSVLHELSLEAGADFVFADLGLSSMQIDDPTRGFTFKHDGPLDMRMNPGRGLSAAQFLARASEAELVRILEENADESHAAHIAAALDERRGTLATTRALADVVRAALEGHARPDEVELCVRRTFQALRIAVNDELGALNSFLRVLPDCLRPGGRAAVLSFHSGEDRRVKHAFRSGLRSGAYSEAPDEVVRAGPEELRANPRASAAKLRWVRRA